jgi:selenocysteine lyase/cysteine desulfurase
VVDTLWADHKILATPIKQQGEYEGIRVTPNIYTTLREIDYFCDVIEKLVKA